MTAARERLAEVRHVLGARASLRWRSVRVVLTYQGLLGRDAPGLAHKAARRSRALCWRMARRAS